jgi:DNA-binding NarL/FixJ family response regulator
MGSVCSNDKPSVSRLRILVVEDHVPFRHFICSILGKRAEWQVIGEVCNGLDAVHKAQELQPDLILLDIGLPGLNGIEAARRICKLAPSAKIVFLSQESSIEIVRGALSFGAKGYVLKANAARDLLAAVEAAVRGEKFITAELTKRSFSNPQ